jgi:hypothetical protein
MDPVPESLCPGKYSLREDPIYRNIVLRTPQRLTEDCETFDQKYFEALTNTYRNPGGQGWPTIDGILKYDELPDSDAEVREIRRKYFSNHAGFVVQVPGKSRTEIVRFSVIDEDRHICRA